MPLSAAEQTLANMNCSYPTGGSNAIRFFEHGWLRLKTEHEWATAKDIAPNVSDRAANP